MCVAYSVLKTSCFCGVMERLYCNAITVLLPNVSIRRYLGKYGTSPNLSL